MVVMRVNNCHFFNLFPMKSFLTFFILFLLYFQPGMAQESAEAPVFNPLTMPVGIEIDSNMQLMVSNFTLLRSLKAQMPDVERVDKVTNIRQNGVDYLVFTVKLRSDPARQYIISIRLQKVPNGLYYVTNQSITCGKGCAECENNCNSACAGGGEGCKQVASRKYIPLARVTLSIE